MSTFIGRYLNDETLEAVQRLAPIAQELGISMAQLTIAWVLREETVASAIIGASRPEQVHDNAGASGVPMSEDTLRAIDEALGDVPVTDAGQLAPGAAAGVTHRV